MPANQRRCIHGRTERQVCAACNREDDPMTTPDPLPRLIDAAGLAADAILELVNTGWSSNAEREALVFRDNLLAALDAARAVPPAPLVGLHFHDVNGVALWFDGAGGKAVGGPADD